MKHAIARKKSADTPIFYIVHAQQIENNLDKFFKDVTNIKIPSFLYIDDRAVCFKGNYQETLNEVKNFRVYWK